jgi:hypothetical protein
VHTSIVLGHDLNSDLSHASAAGLFGSGATARMGLAREAVFMERIDIAESRFGGILSKPMVRILFSRREKPNGSTA